MAAISLTELIEDAKGRAEMLGSDFVSESLWKSFINKGLGNLYDILVSSYGDDYFAETSKPLDIAQGAGKLDLPVNFYKLIGIEMYYMGQWRSMKDFQFAERSLLSGLESAPRYCIQSDKILIRPENHTALKIRLVYIPEFQKLSALGETFNFKSSWDDYVILTAAIKAKDLEESDVSVLAAELDFSRQNIIKMAPNRDANRPKKVIDTESVDSQYFPC
jgi:hypothetical protein